MLCGFVTLRYQHHHHSFRRMRKLSPKKSRRVDASSESFKSLSVLGRKLAFSTAWWANVRRSCCELVGEEIETVVTLLPCKVEILTSSWPHPLENEWKIFTLLLTELKMTNFVLYSLQCLRQTETHLRAGQDQTSNTFWTYSYSQKTHVMICLL